MVTTLEMVGSAIAFAVNVTVFILVVFVARLPSTRTTRTLLLLIGTIVLWNAGDLVDRGLSYSGAGHHWLHTVASHYTWVGVIPIGALLPLFALEVSRSYRALQHPVTRPGLWLLSVAFIGVAFATRNDHGDLMTVESWGFTAFTLYFALALFSTLGIFVHLVVRPRAALVRRQAILMAIGVGVPVVIGVTNDLIFNQLGISTAINGIGDILSPAFTVSMGYAVFRERMFLVQITTEQAAGRPGTPMGRATFGPGAVKVFLGSAGEARRTFGDLTRAGQRGVIFTTDSAAKVRREAGLRTTPVLEFRERPVRNQLNPLVAEHREMVPLIIEDVAAEVGPPVVLVDGYAMLAAFIEKDARHVLAGTIRDTVRRFGGVLLISEGTASLPPWEVEWLKSLSTRDV